MQEISSQILATNSEDNIANHDEEKAIVIMKYLEYMTKSVNGDFSTAEEAGYLLNGYLTEKGYALYEIASNKEYPKVIIEPLTALDKLFKQ